MMRLRPKVNYSEGFMAKSKVTGVCHVCGEVRPLSFEHIPPQSLGNTNLSKVYSAVEIAERTGGLDFDGREGLRYRQEQRGSGFNTLCSSCNSYFGRNYVKEYAAFARALGSLFVSEDLNDARGIHIETDKANVLAVFKHIVSNFCATTQPRTMLDCKDFLRDRESNAFPDHYRVFMYAVPTMDGPMVTTGWCNVLIDPVNLTGYTVAHVATFPIGYAMVDTNHGNVVPNNLGCDITAMAQCPWGERPPITLELPYMDTKMTFPRPIG